MMEQKMTKEQKAALVRDYEMALQASLVDTHPDTHITSKSMFGGAGFFVDGLIFAAWFGEATIHLKLPKEDQQKLLLIEGTKTDGGHYVEVPNEFLSDMTQLGHWVGLSIDHVRLLPSKKRKRKA